MIFVPRGHQELMIEHALRYPRCAIWADMGLGKTSAMLYAASCLALVEPQPVLVLAPRRVALSVWPGEVKKFSNLNGIEVRPIIGTREQRTDALLDKRADIYTINYDNLPWLMDTCKERGKWPFRKIIADESTRLKNFRLRGGGRRAKALSQITHTHTTHWIELTGTPSPNGLIDLWGQMWFVDGGKRLGRTFTAFLKRWFHQNFDGTIAPNDNARQQIEYQLKDICLSVRAQDWFPVDEPIVTNIEVELPADARRYYNEMERRMFVEIAGKSLEAMNAAAATLKCLQIANGAAYATEEQQREIHGTRGPREWVEIHNAKLVALESVYEESAGAPLIVAYHFKSDLARIRSKFPDALTLDDKYFPGMDKYKNVEEMWNAGKVRMLLLHPASAGHGLNLQDGGNRLVFFGHWWDLEQRMQIIERIGPVRQKQSGYDRPVYVYNIVAKDTVDELVISRVAQKREVQDLLREAMAKRGM